VLQEMLKSDTNLGGESSGHVIFLEHNTTGDGLVSALQVLRIMIETGSKLSELAGAFKKFPQICLNVKVLSKPPIDTIQGFSQAIAEVEQALGSTGRLLVRYSGTEPILRIMVEGPKRSLIHQYAEQLAAIVRTEIGS
jgi:phosphoglucosamine mutase